MVTVAAQLSSMNVISEASLERIGHWGKNSSMPKLYDAESCVTELQTRQSVVDAVRTGWRPVPDGNLPVPCTPTTGKAAPATPTTAVTQPPLKRARMDEGQTSSTSSASSSSGTVVVFNTQRRKFHRAATTKSISICGWWTCGTTANPASNAIFGYNGTGTKCSKCFGQ